MWRLGAAWLVVCPHLLAHHGLVPHRAAPAAVLLRPGDREQALVREGLAELLGHREISRVVGEGAQVVLCDVGGDQLAQTGTQRRRLLAEIEVHQPPLPNLTLMLVT